MQKELAAKILQEIRANYNLIAENFSLTRENLWQDILPLLDYTKKSDRVLDLGCGNGRLFRALKEKQVDYIGCDVSENLIAIARQKYPQAKFLPVDGLNLPFANNSFDIIYCIAVLHHIPSRDLRIKFLQEVKRVLKPGGLFAATCWKLNQRKSAKLIFKFSLLKVAGGNKMDFGDVLVPWQNKCQRYIHNFTKRGLGKLVRAAGFSVKKIGVLVRQEKKDSNIFIVAQSPRSSIGQNVSFRS